ncbi:GGDEF domain-containing protein [Parasulfuritortus cantonensis]|uniref:GGDEF domain-containing protein n=1 Tax=Parasulfuritortus cantonensis TaxID=2528202 RepID=A0A4R1BLF4_9PROT|nr:GGDEF domain-containing protein [Parasulfuritortus cantonensis]TCJ18213.1 GGDEF domain-containing protein [Parasulfuritortus cantonensis]
MELASILRHRRLQPLLQPILDLEDAGAHGYEGLIRGPSDSVLHSPFALLRAADQAGLRLETELLCIDIIVADFARQGLAGRLFLNLSPRLMVDHHPLPLERLQATLRAHSVAPERIVIELTEDAVPAESAALLDVLPDYRGLGLHIALDDLGEGYSSLRRWSELRPHYVKIDKHFVSGINQDPVKLQFVRSLQQIAVNSGARLIAEGVETRAELGLMRELGIRFAQGYFIGRPMATPGVSLEVLEAMKTGGRGQVVAGFNVQADKLLIEAPVLRASDSNETALDLFKSHAHLHALAVVESARPIGLVNRYTLIDHFSRVFVRELHGRRSCTQFMDPAPLVVDRATPVEELSKLVVHKGKATFTDGFVITDDGAYLGIGSGFDLMQVIMQLQITAARYSNPLTQLPGNVPINNHIQRLLDEGLRFRAAYCDIDNFKPFNDIYGYDRGDEVILLVSEVLREGVEAGRDFLGHIGGDDFFILFRSDDWEDRCMAILARFQARCARLYEAGHVIEGGYYSEDRAGHTVFHPLPTLSIGIVDAEAAAYRSHHEVAATAAVAKKQAKKQAKKKPGNSLFVERRRAPAPVTNLSPSVNSAVTQPS